MPDDVEKAKALFFEALEYIEKLDFKTAELRLREALQFTPTSVSILTNLAVVLSRQDKFTEARAQAEKAIAAKSSNIEALLILADCYAKEQKLDEALNFLNQVIAINPTLADVHNNVGLILAERRNYTAALASYDRAIEIEPNFSDTHKNRGIALHGLGRYEEALRAYDMVLAYKPDSAEAWNNRGCILFHRGQYPEARASFRNAIKFDPDLFDAASALIDMHLSEGNFPEALQVARKMLETKKTDETKALVVSCLRSPLATPNHGDLRDLLLQAISEPWARPADLALTCARFLKLNDAIRSGIGRVEKLGQGSRPRESIITTSTIAALAKEPLFLALLETTPITDLALERFVKDLRFSLLTVARSTAGEIQSDQLLITYCAIARQCFINNYVFGLAGEESEQARALRESVIALMASGAPISALSVVAVAAYFPLHALPNATLLLDHQWPKAVAALLAQQVSAPLEEKRLRGLMPVLTDITDKVSMMVRSQYEDNPYPQWVKVKPSCNPKPLDTVFRNKFPFSSFVELRKDGGTDVLIAGCGTGQQSIEATQRFKGCQVLAIDISMTSLCYAERQTRALGLKDIRYAHADIMNLPSTGLTFDVIESAGVLHHLADPFAGWRALLSLLRHRGIMLIGLYSEIGRRDIVAAHNFIAKRGYRPIADDIRKCREDIISSPESSRLKNILTLRDFYSLDECRDLLFHVQEHRFSLPQIAPFLSDNSLNFLGFELDLQVRRDYLRCFPADTAMTDLAHWHTYETNNPDTFRGMYIFWVQKK